jgi:hypothetical protein
MCALWGLLRFTRSSSSSGGDDAATEFTFELSDVVQSINMENSGGDPDFAARFAERLYHRLGSIWEHFATHLDRPFTSEQGIGEETASRRLAQIVYANRCDDGTAFLSTIDLMHTIRRSGTGSYDSVLHRPIVRLVLHGAVQRPQVHMRGKLSCAQPPAPLLAGEGDAGAMRAIDAIFAGAQRSARCAAAIGGPIDVGVIDGSGRRWLRRKEEIAVDAG